MGITRKSRKGEISIENFRGNIRLRWRYNGVRYPLSLPYKYALENMHFATVIAAEIKLDIMKGDFDDTLQKYKPAVSLPEADKPLKESIPKNEEILLHSLIPKYDEWTKDVRNIDLLHSIDYLGVKRLLEKYTGAYLSETARKIAVENWSVSTYNKRLSFLCSFFNWLEKGGIIPSNPLKDINKRREKKKRRKASRIPMTEEEIETFLKAIRNDTFLSPYSPYKHSHYYAFLKFIFVTGVRNAEAVGLKVKHIDLVQRRIEISEALARTTKGSHHAARISKGTKTDNTRYLPMSEELEELLLPLIDNKPLENLIFLSPKGEYMCQME